MTLVILKELEKYTPNTEKTSSEHDFINMLKLDPKSEHDYNLYQSILKELKDTTFFKHVRPSEGLEDIQTEYDEENLIESNDDSYIKNKEYFFFTFTGILIINGLSIIVYPKHVENIDEDIQNNFKKFKQLVNVIQKYQKQKPKQSLSFFENEENKMSNKLSLAIQLLNYYDEYGLYKIEDSIIEENGQGNILWEKTINETPIVLSGKSPVYLNLYTDASEIDELHFIRQIQIAIMTDIKNSFGDILSILDYTTYSENNLTLDMLGDNFELLYHLENEKRRQFVSHKIELINMLALYIQDISRIDKVSSIEVFGINQFHHVWEDVCKVIYGNDLERTIEDIGLKYIGERSTKLKEVVEKPIWTLEGAPNQYYSKESLKLDVLHIDKKNKIFNIYDAKYFLITFDDKNKKALNAPGINDITKQYLYELAYKKLATLQNQNYKFTNQFIVPKDNYQDEDGKVISKISLPMFKSLNLSDIKVIARDCETIFNEYLNLY